MRARALVAGLAVAALCLAAGPASAGSPLLLLELSKQPVESPDTLLGESVRRDALAPPAPRPDAPEVMPDGSVRYGKMATLTIKNPCPEGDLLHGKWPRPLPGRTRR